MLNEVRLGTAPNNGTGDSLRTGGGKINANFQFLKAYVDNLLQGLKWKQKVDIATTANITLSGEQTIDGILTAGSRVLVKDQTNPLENGIYVSAAGAWSRSLDADLGAELVNATVSVVSGTVNANTNWTCNAETLELGTDPVTWVSFSNISSGVSLEQLQMAIDELEGTINTALEGKVDDSQVLTDVPEGAVFTDTVYDDTALSNRVTDVENNKQDAIGYTPANDSEVVKSVSVNGGAAVEPDEEGNVDLTVEGGFTEITENQYGTHPAFSDQHAFNVWVLQNIEGNTPSLKVSNTSQKGFDYSIT